jgi:predicted nucleic acid-binding protein
MPVVDASVMVEYLTYGEHGDQVRERILGEGHSLWTPHLIDAEVGHALRRGALQGKISKAAAGEALWQLVEMPLRRVSHELLVRYAWAMRDNLSFYDALYVALAEMLGQPLLTLDARIARASGVRAEVEVLAQAA